MGLCGEKTNTAAWAELRNLVPMLKAIGEPAGQVANRQATTLGNNSLSCPIAKPALQSWRGVRMKMVRWRTKYPAVSA